MAFSFKTSISFGLVYVPVRLYNCVKENDISFNQLYKKTGERIKYKKTCANCPSNVNVDDIVRGYEYEKNKYVTITDEEIEKIKSTKNKSIDIIDFVKLEEIDPVFFDKSFFIEPADAKKAFSLIAKAIEDENKVGIAKTILGSKEQLAAIRVIDKKMILTTMHFADEIQENPVKEIEENFSENELKLAKNVIENMTTKFNPEKYKNEYREKLIKAIETKVQGKEIIAVSERKYPNVISIMDALKKSVEKTKKKTKNTTKVKHKKEKEILKFQKRA